MRIIYLHGFASSPQSTKTQYFAEKIPNLIIPDLNQNDFGHLTISRQIKQIQPLLTEPSYVIGSSLGGLTAVVLAEQFPEIIKKIVLLAPAFKFTQYWRNKLGTENLAKWQLENYLPIFHYSYKQEIPLHYEFFRDAEQYDDYPFTNTVEALILHGIHDKTVPIVVSEEYAQNKPWVKFTALDSDHSLVNCLPTLWEKTQDFLADY